MKTLIVEDDFIARRLLKEILSSIGECDIAIDGEEAVQAFRMALDDPKTVVEAYYRGGATSYLVKPITRKKLMDEIREMHLIQ